MSESTIEIQIDISAMTIDDLDLMASDEMAGESGNRGQVKAIIDLLDRIVIGGVRGRGIPLTDFGSILEKVQEAMGEAANPNPSSSA